MESFTGTKDLRSEHCTYFIDFKNTIPVGIHTHEATQNIPETCVLSFSVDEKNNSADWNYGSRILHSQTVPRNDSVYLTPLAFTEVFLFGNRAGFLKQREWVLERRKSSHAVKPQSV